MRRLLAGLLAVLLSGVLGMGPAATPGEVPGAAAAAPAARGARPAEAIAREPSAPVRPVAWPPPPRREIPEDRYAMAGGCYAIRSLATGRYVARTPDGFAAVADRLEAAEPFRFQAVDLGRYLLYGSREDFLAVEGDPVGSAAALPFDAAAGVVRGTGRPLAPLRGFVLDALEAGRSAADAALGPVRAALRSDRVVAAPRPSEWAEWLVREAGGRAFTLQLPVPDGREEEPGPVDPPVLGTLATAPDGRLRLAGPDAAGAEIRFTFVLTRGCARYPEVEVNVDGPPAKGKTPYEEVRGFLDAHLHLMAFEFLGGRAHCGRPWHPYGAPWALVDCPDHEPGGHGALLEAAVSGGDPVRGHDTHGWPTFAGWPRHDSLTHEQVYYKWLERAWRAGLRLITVLLVENGVLCELYPYKKNSCDEMESVRLQARRLRELERYIDAQSGGPGEGWFRIVDDPFEARRVINAGKLAVVMGIEVSSLFGCDEYLGQPRCDPVAIDRQLDEVYRLGVRQLELVNKFDNALSGVAGDSGTTGILVNTGNFYLTGHFWRMETCEDPHAHDKTQLNPADHGLGALPGGDRYARDALLGAVLQVAGRSGLVPVYPPGPHCNAQGLTPLGEYVILRMMERGMIFDPDHMSALGRRQALDLLERHGYGGVISSHSWADDPSYRRIYRLGGVVTPMAGDAERFVEEWRRRRAWADPRFAFGFGYGSDVNGFARQGRPRRPPEDRDVDYPFQGFGGVTVHRQVSGQRVYDVNVDGVAHYGLYPDWIEDLRVMAGDAIVQEMLRGAEAYLQMWERAIGIAPDSCRPDVPGLTAADLARLRRGMTPEEVLLTVGQPHRREGTTFTYCAASPAGKVRVVVRFDPRGRLAAVTGPRTGGAGRGTGLRP